MSKLLSVERIHSFSQHPNSEATQIECAKVLGWPVVIKKNEFKENELIIFVFPDTLVDKENPYFKFMESRKWRVWLAKFKKSPSAGLVCPLSILDFYNKYKKEDLVEGQDLSDLPGFSKFEKNIDFKAILYTKGGFLTHLIDITNEENLLSNLGVEDEFRNKESYISLKIDGSSMTIINYNNEFDVCSRRLRLKETDNNPYWIATKKYNLQEKLKDLNIGIQAECAGPKLNGNPLGLNNYDLFVFNIKDLDKMEYLGLDKIIEWCDKLEIKIAPLIQRFVYDETWDVDRLQEIANDLKYSNNKASEGLVLRPIEPFYSYVLQKNLSVKLINQNYKS